MRDEKASSVLGRRGVGCFAFAAVVVICCPGGSTADQPYLSLVTSTRTQIVLQWVAPESGVPIGYELQRSAWEDFSIVTTLALPPKPTMYSDTGFSPDDRRRLSSTTLSFGVPYYYRIRAQYESSWSDYSNTVSASLRYPVRGEAGDLFADIVLGQIDFAQNSPGATMADTLQMGAGILIDSGATPERAYFVDANHNRILGFSDIHARPLVPNIVIGQPDFHHSAANGDATLQGFPEFPMPSASTLALIPLDHLSVFETVLINQLAVDATGNLYVADNSNHRVLKYEDPFATDTVADEVWGQPDFSTCEPNYGGISNQSLRFMVGHTSAGVSIDPWGSLWVADSANHRVLRFPYDSISGHISKTADLVLGQPDFVSSSLPWWPSTVQVDEDGSVYIAEFQLVPDEPSRIAVYEPPLSNGMAPTRELATNPTVNRPTCLLLDPLDRGIWVQNILGWSSTTRLLDLTDGHIISSILLPTTQSRGMGVDSMGNAYVHSMLAGIYVYPPPYDEGDRELIFEDRVLFTGRDFGRATGTTTFGDQLIVVDGVRLLIWNDWRSVETYDHADDVWGQESFDVNDTYPFWVLGNPMVDEKQRLWIVGYIRNDRVYDLRFLAFDYPLTHDSEPVKNYLNTFDLVEGTDTISTCRPPEWFGFDLADGGDQMWIADERNNRVLRLNNIDGENDPGRGPYVDVVLGQPDIASTEPNQGGDIGPDTFYWPRLLAVDADGNLFVSDTGGETGTNMRILIFDGALFPDDLDHILYAVPATGVLGTGGDFTILGCVDETCDPWHIDFHQQAGIMVTTMGPYNHCHEHFPLVYLDPLQYDRPQAALGDFCPCSRLVHIDIEGNVYVTDGCWSRVLIFKRPFLRFSQTYTGFPESLWLGY
jgi:sugar lactone lactonase YvrE